MSSNSISVECIQRSERSNMDICDIWINISETVHAMTNGSMKDIYEVTYDLSVYLMTCDIGCHLKVKSRPHDFKNLYLINNASFDEIHIYYVIYVYSVVSHNI